MSKSKRTLLRSLLVGILSIVPAIGLAVTTSTGAMMSNSSSSHEASMNQTTPQSQQEGQMMAMPSSDTSTYVETPVGGAGAEVDVPGVNPDIDVNTATPLTPDIGVSLTSDTTPMNGGTGMSMHQDSNGISEATNPIAPPGPGEDGIPVQPVPGSTPGGKLANQPPMLPNGGFGAKVQTTSEQNPQVTNQDQAIGVSIETTHYRGGGHYRGWHGNYYNRGYYGHGYYYGGSHYYYGYQPYGYYYPYQGYYYYY